MPTSATGALAAIWTLAAMLTGAARTFGAMPESIAESRRLNPIVELPTAALRTAAAQTSVAMLMQMLRRERLAREMQVETSVQTRTRMSLPRAMRLPTEPTAATPHRRRRQHPDIIETSETRGLGIALINRLQQVG
jgi:hypothetical protein